MTTGRKVELVLRMIVIQLWILIALVAYIAGRLS